MWIFIESQESWIWLCRFGNKIYYSCHEILFTLLPVLPDKKGFLSFINISYRPADYKRPEPFFQVCPHFSVKSQSLCRECVLKNMVCLHIYAGIWVFQSLVNKLVSNKYAYFCSDRIVLISIFWWFDDSNPDSHFG